MLSPLTMTGFCISIYQQLEWALPKLLFGHARSEAVVSHSMRLDAVLAVWL
jgi:hypothetical protein